MTITCCNKETNVQFYYIERIVQTYCKECSTVKSLSVPPYIPDNQYKRYIEAKHSKRIVAKHKKESEARAIKYNNEM